ncbi:MAG TPA: HxsD-like protein [Polyangiaceae bacterium]
MTSLRLHRDLYAASAVDRAVGVYAPHAALARREDAPYWVVEISAKSPERERRVAGELGNYALGLTVKERKR